MTESEFKSKYPYVTDEMLDHYAKNRISMVLNLSEAMDYIDKDARAIEWFIAEGFKIKQPSTSQANVSDFISSCLKTMESFEEKQPQWLVDGLIPKGCISILASDGGIGKTSLVVSLAAAISSGMPSIFDADGFSREAGTVCLFSMEDSIESKLKPKLRLCGADMKKIVAYSFKDDVHGLSHQFKLGEKLFEDTLAKLHPTLCVLDPIQSFFPVRADMKSRNCVRDCMSPLISLGERYGITFLILAHSNKRQSAFGRDRLSESSDLWDCARSVLMAGETEEEGIKYVSNEKNSYAERAETILFSMNSCGVPVREGTTWKRDKEYQAEKISASKSTAPKLDDCIQRMRHELEEKEGIMPIAELEKILSGEGYSQHTIRRAKDTLKSDGTIKYKVQGFGTDKVWKICLIDYHCTANLL